jgi:hypothetical protein
MCPCFDVQDVCRMCVENQSRGGFVFFLLFVDKVTSLRHDFCSMRSTFESHLQSLEVSLLLFCALFLDRISSCE